MNKNKKEPEVESQEIMKETMGLTNTKPTGQSYINSLTGNRVWFDGKKYWTEFLPWYLRIWNRWRYRND